MNEHITAVQRMQDYIADHLDEEISLSALSRAALFSPWYSYRLFRRYTGVSVADYIRKLRLSESAKQLKNGGRVTDTALSLGFGSADGYTRAFTREFGLTPSEYLKTRVPLTLFIPYGVKFRELRKDNQEMEITNNIFIQVIRKPGRKALIKRGISAADYFPYMEEVGCDIWGLLTSMDSITGEPTCMWLSPKYVKPGTSVYVMGVEVPHDYRGILPEGFDIIDLPDTEYLMFQGEPFDEEDYCDAISDVTNAMDRYDPSVIGYEWDDSEPRIQSEPKGSRGYICMRAVRRI